MEVLSERHKTERKGKKDGGEGEENIQDLEQQRCQARSLPAFEILSLVWQAKNLIYNTISIHFSLKMPSRFEKCLQLLIESMTRSHTHGLYHFFFFTNLENFVVSCLLGVPVQPPQSHPPFAVMQNDADLQW